MNAEAKAGSSGSASADADAQADFAGDVEARADQRDADQLDKPIEAQEMSAVAPLAERPLLGARRDLSYAGSTEPKCSCLAVALGQPGDSAFQWKEAAPRIDPATQMIVAVTSEGVSCAEEKGEGASYKGYVLSGGDVIVTVERAHAKRPVAVGAIIPRPAGEGQVYVVPDSAKLPFGRPLDGAGDRCQLGNPGAGEALAAQDTLVPVGSDSEAETGPEDAPEEEPREVSEFVDEVDEYGIEKEPEWPRTRDGFFLGFHLAGDYMILNSSTSAVGRTDTKTTGIGVGIDALIGGTPSEGLAIGAILGGGHFPSPSFEEDGESSDEAFDLNLFHIGAFIDYYTSPDSGFHMLGEVAYAQLGAASDINFEQNLKGVALGVGLGYDWWVSNGWSLGLLGRFTFSPLKRDEYNSSTQLYLPSLAFTATYH
jgi:hypothetical protein